MIDMASNSIENITQYFSISKSTSYLISFQWLPPILNPLSNKSLTIAINQIPLDTIYINNSNYQITVLKNYSIKANLQSGIN